VGKTGEKLDCVRKGGACCGDGIFMMNVEVEPRKERVGDKIGRVLSSTGEGRRDF